MSLNRFGVMLDRDGTMSPVGGYCHPNDFVLLPQTAEAIRLLNGLGIPVIVVTNQTGVRNGRFTREELLSGFRRIEEELGAQGAHLDGIFCSVTVDSRYHKPAPGMILAAAEQFGLDLERSWMVGDSGSSDMKAAAAAGCRSILVKTGWGVSSLEEYREDWAEISPDSIVEDILEAAKLIRNRTEPQPTAKLHATEYRVF